MSGWRLGLSVGGGGAVSFYQGGSYTLLFKVGIMILVAVDLHASAAASTLKVDPPCAVVDIPLVLVVPIEELTLNGRIGKAVAVNELVALLTLPLRLAGLGADVYVLKS